MSSHKIDFASFGALIIDDNPFIRYMVEKHLFGFGFRRIYHAEDGRSGIEVLTEKKPEIVICDINMDNMNGFEFLKEVRGLKNNTSKIPIIFLTSSAEETNVKKAMDLEIDSYLLKPVMPTFLKMRILKIIENKMML